VGRGTADTQAQPLRLPSIHPCTRPCCHALSSARRARARTPLPNLRHEGNHRLEQALGWRECAPAATRRRHVHRNTSRLCNPRCVRAGRVPPALQRGHWRQRRGARPPLWAPLPPPARYRLTAFRLWPRQARPGMHNGGSERGDTPLAGKVRRARGPGAGADAALCPPTGRVRQRRRPASMDDKRWPCRAPWSGTWRRPRRTSGNPA
jgi:hypothetical protein